MAFFYSEIKFLFVEKFSRLFFFFPQKAEFSKNPASPNNSEWQIPKSTYCSSLLDFLKHLATIMTFKLYPLRSKTRL